MRSGEERCMTTAKGEQIAVLKLDQDIVVGLVNNLHKAGMILRERMIEPEFAENAIERAKLVSSELCRLAREAHEADSQA
jgi:hypothetical protein